MTTTQVLDHAFAADVSLSELPFGKWRPTTVRDGTILRSLGLPCYMAATEFEAVYARLLEEGFCVETILRD